MYNSHLFKHVIWVVTECDTPGRRSRRTVFYLTTLRFSLHLGQEQDTRNMGVSQSTPKITAQDRAILEYVSFHFYASLS